eukprot:156727-Chlamydomonas_euryale.AAC.1
MLMGLADGSCMGMCGVLVHDVRRQQGPHATAMVTARARHRRKGEGAAWAARRRSVEATETPPAGRWLQQSRSAWRARACTHHQRMAC